MQISLLEDIKGGPYVEFNISGDEDYFHWCRSSCFLYEPVFGLFEDCFDRVSDSFNYYGPTIFIGRKLKELEVELKKTATALNDIKSRSELLDYLNGKALGGNFTGEMDEEYPDWRNNFEDVLNSLRSVNSGLISIIRRCISEKRVLWVLGI